MFYIGAHANILILGFLFLSQCLVGIGLKGIFHTPTSRAVVPSLSASMWDIAELRVGATISSEDVTYGDDGKLNVDKNLIPPGPRSVWPFRERTKCSALLELYVNVRADRAPPSRTI